MAEIDLFGMVALVKKLEPKDSTREVTMRYLIKVQDGADYAIFLTEQELADRLGGELPRRGQLLSARGTLALSVWNCRLNACVNDVTHMEIIPITRPRPN